MQKRWLVKLPEDTTTLETLRSTLKVDTIVAELLLQRGIRSFAEAEAFFRPDLKDLHDPFLMKDMDNAVARLQEAIDRQERVLLFGDYDVDGTTAVALLYTFLKETLPVEFYIPDRYKEGYGISKQGIDVAHANNVGLIIALDCGVKAIEEVRYAKELGIDFIVCDHHNPGAVLPDAIVLDPKRKDCAYPYKELSGCGVGFKLLQGLCDLNGWKYDRLFAHLDLLALSIGADIVPVTGENRILCFHGMKLLNEHPRVAFRELLTLANKTVPITLTDVVFTIAPRINAVGRLRSGRYAVELMVSEDPEEISALASEINTDNAERRELDQKITQEALELLDESAKMTNVVFKSNWHKGVVGIVASRIVEKRYRPTVVLTESEGKITGSARSIKHFDIHEALEKCADLLEQFGGHKYAAGVTLSKDNLEAFKQRFESVVAELMDPTLLVEEQEIDVEIDFGQIYLPEENRMKLPRLKRILKQFEPHGPGNMKPVFISKNVFSTHVRLLKEHHLKLSMTQPTVDVVMDGIAFNMSNKQDAVSSGIPFDVVYTLEENRWNGRETLQLNIKDIREAL